MGLLHVLAAANGCVWNIGGIITGRVNPKYFEKYLPQCHFATINPTWTTLELNPRFSHEKSATNILSYGKVLLYEYFSTHILATSSLIYVTLYAVVSCLSSGLGESMAGSSGTVVAIAMWEGWKVVHWYESPVIIRIHPVKSLSHFVDSVTCPAHSAENGQL
jgi:hypothetical protein